MEPVVTFNEVTKQYGDVRALAGLTFDVMPGEMFGIIGPDGAGKTTAVRVACGLVRRDGGSVRVMQHDPWKDRFEIAKSVGYLSQRFSLYGDLSVDENIAFSAEIHGVWRHGERRNRLLEMTGLTPFRDRLADRLSGGMKQKLALACTLIHEPDLILLDEPTTGVDPVSRREFWKLLSDFRAQGITIVLTTPYLDEAERCSRVALLHRGTLLALDAPGTLRQQYSGTVVEVVAEPRRVVRDALSGIDGVEDVQSFGDRAHARLRPGTDFNVDRITAHLRRAGVAESNVRRVTPSLEDVFVQRVMTMPGDDPGRPRSEPLQ